VKGWHSCIREQRAGRQELQQANLPTTRVASGIVRNDRNCLARLPADGVSRIGGRASNRRGVPRFIERFSAVKPKRMVGGEIAEASGSALQERAAIGQHLIQPIEMRAQLIKQVRHCRHHCGGIDISASWPAQFAYYAVATSEALQKPAVRQFRDWLVEEARQQI
jgi:hypothetical protein